MKFTRICLAFLAWLPIAAVRAQQTVTPRPANPSSIAPPIPRVEGTVESDGVTAQLDFEAPDKLRIETPAWVVVTDKDSTLVLENSTQRSRRLPWNIAREPWRGSDLLSGGPANVAIVGLTRAAYEKAYRPGFADAGVFALEARPEAARRVRDIVGANADRSSVYYAVSTAAVFDGPQTLKLTYDKGALVSREEIRGGVSTKAVIESDPATKLPKTATVDGHTYIYSLKPRDKEYTVDTFEFPDRGGIIEDARLPALADITGKDAASVLGRGRLTAIHLEDYASAIKLFEEAAALEPRATAPHFLAYEAALTRRDLARAGVALDALTEILGENPGVFARRATLASLRRDWPAALSALEKAEQAATDVATKNEARILRANLLRTRGDVAAARGVLIEALKTEAPSGAEAAAALAAGVTADEVEAVRGTLPDTEAGRLAGAMLDLQTGKLPTYSPEAAPVEVRQGYKNALALAAARAGRFELAAGLTTDPQLQLFLGAQRGDTASLKTFRDLLARIPTENAKNAARNTLTAAWAKSFRLDDLKSALDNRALAGAATSDDWRSLLTYQESRGSLEEIGTTVRAGASRFPDAAWWSSRQADQLIEERAATPIKETTARARMRTDALEKIERARELDPAQVYYPMQELLLLIDAVTENSSMISNPQEKAQFRRRAEELLPQISKEWAGNADVALLATLARTALSLPTAEMVDLVEDALASGAPDMDADRHATTFFARQALAMHWRRLKEYNDAAREYELLLDAARTPTEETGIAFNYLLMLQGMAAPKPAAGDGDAPAPPPAPADEDAAPAAGAAQARAAATPAIQYMAALLGRLAAEPWPLEAHNGMMSQIVDVILHDRTGALPLAALLAKGNAAQQLAGARIQLEAERAFAAAAAVPDAPATADRALREAQNQAEASVASLQEIARGTNKTLAARALVLLAERAANGNNPTDAAQLLRQAITLEPAESALRVALADAVLSFKKVDEAVAVRDALVREVPQTADSLRRAASLSLRLRQPARAAELAQSAQRLAQFSAAGTPADVETASLVLARALWADGKSDRAEEIYKKLTAAQWPPADRAAALLDWSASLRAAGREDEADRQQALMTNIGPTETELRDARALLDSL